MPNQLKRGISPCDKIALQLGITKTLHAKWIVELYVHMQQVKIMKRLIFHNSQKQNKHRIFCRIIHKKMTQFKEESLKQMYKCIQREGKWTQK